MLSDGIFFSVGRLVLWDVLGVGCFVMGLFVCDSSETPLFLQDIFKTAAPVYWTRLMPKISYVSDTTDLASALCETPPIPH